MSTVKRYEPNKPSSKHSSMLAGVLLYLVALPLLPAAIRALAGGHASAAIGYAVGFAAAMVAATMIRRGLVIESEAKRRKIVRRASTVPYKLTGSIVLGIGMFVVAMASGYSLLLQPLFGLAAGLGAYLYYGTDPSRNAAAIASVGMTSEELIALLDEGEARIETIEQARKDIRNPEFRQKLQKITEGAREILDTIEEDPSDARKARKFLKVYLDGAQQVTQGYARMHKSDDGGANIELEDNFRRVLGTIETVIDEQKLKLAENNALDLDVQMEVLQLQLEKEGVT